MFDLFVEAAESDQVLVVVEVDGVLDVLPVLRMLGVGVTVVSHLGRSLESHFSYFLLYIKQRKTRNTENYFQLPTAKVKV